MIAEQLVPLATPLGDLSLLPGNPRRGDVGAVARSLEVFGQRKAIVANRDGTIIAGNHTFQAAQSLGWSEIAVVFVDDDDATAKAYALADNRTAELGGYDDEALIAYLSQVQASDAELLAATGWSDGDLAALMAATTELPAPLEDPDAVPDLPAEPTSVLGDVWVLGPHRLVCGDSTDVGVFDALMRGALADCVWTDPPYGIDYRAMRGGDLIANDGDAVQAEQVIRDALVLFSEVPAHFVCCDWRSLPVILDAMVGAAIEPKATIVWDKGVRVQNLDRYAKQHEFMVYAGPFGGQPTQCTDVWAHPRDFVPDHPTPKPVSLIEQSLTTATGGGAVVADPFAGSGSTLIACHQTGRVARLVEIDPRYADVICRRYQDATGDKPVLEATGEPHDFCAEQ